MSESKVKPVIYYVAGSVFGTLAYIITNHLRATIHAPPATASMSYGAVAFTVLVIGYCVVRKLAN